MAQKRKWIIISAILFAIVVSWIYFKRIRPTSEAKLLLQYGIPAKAVTVGHCVPIPMPVGGGYFFWLKNKRYRGDFNLDNNFRYVGDSIDVLYLMENPGLNMSIEDAKVHATSVWSIFAISK